MTNSKTHYTKDIAKKQITVVREFNAPVNEVWKAWTTPAMLDQWWAPKPWHAETKRMDFREGGQWLYSMNGPEGEKHWSIADFKKVEEGKSFTGVDGFCDENGNKNSDLPGSEWNVNFDAIGKSTKVTILISFQSEEDMKKLMEMGFEEGFAMGHNNLDDLLEKNK